MVSAAPLQNYHHRITHRSFLGLVHGYDAAFQILAVDLSGQSDSREIAVPLLSHSPPATRSWQTMIPNTTFPPTLLDDSMGKIDPQGNDHHGHHAQRGAGISARSRLHEDIDTIGQRRIGFGGYQHNGGRQFHRRRGEAGDEARHQTAGHQGKNHPLEGSDLGSEQKPHGDRAHEGRHNQGNETKALNDNSAFEFEARGEIGQWQRDHRGERHGHTGHIE